MRALALQGGTMDPRPWDTIDADTVFCPSHYVGVTVLPHIQGTEQQAACT